MVPGVLGVLGVEPRLPEPVLPEPLALPEPVVLPEPLLLPEPLVLPYCFTQSSRSVPVLPMHWLGVAAESLLVLPVAPELVEPEVPEPEVVESELVEPEPLVPALPLTLGLVVEPLLLPVVPEV